MINKYVFIAAVICIQATTAVPPVRFLVVGDWGGSPDPPYQTLIQRNVAKDMGLAGQEFQTQFQIALGDNFYDKGVTSTDDKRFNKTFEEVYTAASLQTRWYVLAGNHDHNGNVSAEVAYTKMSPRWYFPDLFYTFTIPIADSASIIQFVIIDTVVLCGNMIDDTTPLQPKLTLEGQKLASVYWDWIDNQLRSSNANYLIVVGHYPVYSIAEHGPTQCLIDNLQPMLFKYNVTAYVCGHDHNLQHLQVVQGPQTMNYFLIGAGDKIDTSTVHKDKVPPGSLKFHWAELGIMGAYGYVEADAQRMLMSYYNGRGNHVYQYMVYPRY